MAKKGFGNLVLGVLVGASLGILFAPKKGKETRHELKEKMLELVADAKELSISDVSKMVEGKITEIRHDLNDLDKEKVLKTAKKKSEELKKQIEELYEDAKDKATPVVNEAIEALRVQAVNVTKKVLDKLEKENKETKQK